MAARAVRRIMAEITSAVRFPGHTLSLIVARVTWHAEARSPKLNMLSPIWVFPRGTGSLHKELQLTIQNREEASPVCRSFLILADIGAQAEEIRITSEFMRAIIMFTSLSGSLAIYLD